MRKQGIFGTQLSLPQLLLILSIAAAVLVLPGSDIYSNIHWGWLYNYMIEHGVLLEKDFSMLSGNQPLYGAGVFSHILSGLGWSAFGKAIVKILEVLLFSGIVLLSLKIFRNRNMLFFWYAMIFVKILLPDSYPYLLSAFLFYLGIYLIKRFRDKPYGDIAISVAGLNHPYVAVSNMATILFGRMSLFLANVAVLLAQLFVVKYVFLSGAVNFELDNILDLAIRSAILLFPFAAEFAPKFLLRLMNLRAAYLVVAAGVLLVYPVFFVPFEMGWKEGISCYYTKTYDEIPKLQGNIRIVDDCRNWIYVFPLKGMATSLSPYFEGQHYQTEWSEDEYVSYLSETKTSYVIFCKKCKIRTKTLQETGELEILKSNFPIYAELEGYTIFDARKADLGNI
ncbi:hypothetical protein HYY73_05610 [Candidatus Woesearchaeota archaeon]|nr:hypothetical protein [Candidatus Woesearchaeota archaeon]